MEKKARFIRVLKNTNPLDKHAWEHTDLLYEYRGYKYIVTAHNNGYAFDSLYHQHQEEQAKIDAKIEHMDDPVPEWSYSGSGEEGFDLFWNYVNGEEF